MTRAKEMRLGPVFHMSSACNKPLEPTRAPAVQFNLAHMRGLGPNGLAGQIADSTLDLLVARDVLEHTETLADAIDGFTACRAGTDL